VHRGVHVSNLVVIVKRAMHAEAKGPRAGKRAHEGEGCPQRQTLSNVAVKEVFARSVANLSPAIKTMALPLNVVE